MTAVMTSLGVDVGGSSVKIALVRAGRLIATGQSDRYARPDASRLQAAIIQAMPAGVRDASLQAVGLCLPGLFDEASRALAASVNLPGLVGVPVDQLISAALRTATAPALRVHTDAHAAAHDYAEVHRPAGRLLAVSIGTGVGACVLDNGVPLRITGRSSGHLGQLDVSIDFNDETAPVGPDGGRGSLEAYIGLPALLARYGPALTGAFAEPGSSPPLLALARGLRIAHAIYRPDHIALLGGGGLLLRPVLDRLRSLVQHQLTSLARPDWMLSTGDHAFHAAAGAARLALTPPAG